MIPLTELEEEAVIDRFRDMQIEKKEEERKKKEEERRRIDEERERERIIFSLLSLMISLYKLDTSGVLINS